MESNKVGKSFRVTIHKTQVYTSVVFADNAEQALDYVTTLDEWNPDSISKNVHIEEIKEEQPVIED